MKKLALVVIALALVAPTSTPAGGKEDMVKPGPEHKLLASLAGVYDAKVKAYFDPSQGPEETTGTMERKMIMNGLFLQERYNGTAMGKPFFGMGLSGYDKLKKKYTGVWIDSMTSSIMYMMGTYDADKKTFTSTTEDLDPYSGKKMKMRDVLRIVSDTEQIAEMYRQPVEGGAEFKVLEIRYKKK